MRLTPRGEEIEAITDILTSTYDTPELMAADIIKTVALALSMRETFAVSTRWEDLNGTTHGQNFGPYYSDGEAKTAAARLAGTGSQRIIAKLDPPGDLEARWDGVSWYGYCSCTHAPDVHRTIGRTRPCGFQGCQCKKLTVKTKRKAAKK